MQGVFVHVPRPDTSLISRIRLPCLVCVRRLVVLLCMLPLSLFIHIGGNTAGRRLQKAATAVCFSSVQCMLLMSTNVEHWTVRLSVAATVRSDLAEGRPEATYRSCS